MNETLPKVRISLEPEFQQIATELSGDALAKRMEEFQRIFGVQPPVECGIISS
jgi:hypothetical protein